MRKVLFVIIAAIVVALLNVGVSFLDYADFIWVVTIALFLVGYELVGIGFIILSGFLFDIMMHGAVGSTSLSGLLGVGIYVVAKGLGVADRVWQKVLWVAVGLFVCFAGEAVLRNLLEDMPLQIDLYGYWLKGIVVNGVLVGLVYLVAENVARRFDTRNAVKI